MPEQSGSFVKFYMKPPASRIRIICPAVRNLTKADGQRREFCLHVMHSFLLRKHRATELAQASQIDVKTIQDSVHSTPWRSKHDKTLQTTTHTFLKLQRQNLTNSTCSEDLKKTGPSMNHSYDSKIACYKQSQLSRQSNLVLRFSASNIFSSS